MSYYALVVIVISWVVTNLPGFCYCVSYWVT